MANKGPRRTPRSISSGLWPGRELGSVQFAAVVKRLGQVVRAGGLAVPGFRSPPKSPGVKRTIRREADGTTTISVVLRGRPALAVIGDLVDGIVLTTGVNASDAARLRDDLWSAVTALIEETADDGARPTARAAVTPFPARRAA